MGPLGIGVPERAHRRVARMPRIASVFDALADRSSVDSSHTSRCQRTSSIGLFLSSEYVEMTMSYWDSSAADVLPFLVEFRRRTFTESGSAFVHSTSQFASRATGQSTRVPGLSAGRGRERTRPRVMTLFPMPTAAARLDSTDRRRCQMSLRYRYRWVGSGRSEPHSHTSESLPAPAATGERCLARTKLAPHCLCGRQSGCAARDRARGAKKWTIASTAGGR